MLANCRLRQNQRAFSRYRSLQADFDQTLFCLWASFSMIDNDLAANIAWSNNSLRFDWRLGHDARCKV